MPNTFCRAFAAATILGGALALGATVVPPACAQGAGGQESAPKQVELTQAQVDGLVAAQKEVHDAAGAKPDAASEAKLTAAVKNHGFDSLGQYSDVSYSVGLVMAGLDPETKTFVGPATIIKKQIAEVQADKAMPAKDKKEALSELNEALKEGTSDKPSPGNIAIVKTNFDKLSAAMQQSE